MKKNIAVMLTLALVMALAGCIRGGSQGDGGGGGEGGSGSGGSSGGASGEASGGAKGPFTTYTIGNGFTVNFPYAVNSGPDDPYANIQVLYPEGDAWTLLDDPIVKGMMESIKIIY